MSIGTAKYHDLAPLAEHWDALSGTIHAEATAQVWLATAGQTTTNA